VPVTVKVNGVANSLVHKGSNGISMATIPDVCKTPSPGGPVPIPYPNISQSAMLDKGTTTVKADGGMMIAIKGSEFSMSNGDNAGVAGGVKSSTFMKESTWILYSFDVKMDGQGACRLSDKKFQNHENTVDLAGLAQLQAIVNSPEKPTTQCPGRSEHAWLIVEAAGAKPASDKVRDLAAEPKLGPQFEAAAATHNRVTDSKKLSDNDDNAEKVWYECALCGFKREGDHLTDDGSGGTVAVEVKAKNKVDEAMARQLGRNIQMLNQGVVSQVAMKVPKGSKFSVTVGRLKKLAPVVKIIRV
jgi:Domain of unknown function (DUF4150)